MRVVLVDPSRTVLKYVGRLLKARDHEVRPFTDGTAALEYLRSDVRVGALITSGELGSISGLELCWQTRLIAGRDRQIYVLLMSSNQDRHRLIEALDSGADDFIAKPPVAQELYARLRAAERLALMQHELVRLATTDSLTGALNRRAFFERATQASERAQSGAALAAIMFDIDHFKRINDSYGHAIGDKAIRLVAREAAMIDGFVGRLGGEEFAVLLEGATMTDAVQIAEELRSKVAAMRFVTESGVMTLTCSFGVSEWEPADTIDSLLKRADVALYAAKSGGRNRVVGDTTLSARGPGRGLIRGTARG
jgi:two-component system cell cycle response regulator